MSSVTNFPLMTSRAIYAMIEKTATKDGHENPRTLQQRQKNIFDRDGSASQWRKHPTYR